MRKSAKELHELDQEWLTVAEIATVIEASQTGVKDALTALNLMSQSRADRRDRRRTIYPPGSLIKVDEWIENATKPSSQ